jgi:hypothetical protein
MELGLCGVIWWKNSTDLLFHSAPFLKGQCHKIFASSFFSRISFPPALEYSVKTVSNFFKNSRIFESQGAPLVSTTPAENFSASFATVVDIGDKFDTGVNDTSGKQ